MSEKENQSSVAQMLPHEDARGWSLPPYRNQVKDAGLYLVSTPIGNLIDISVRALDTLAAVDVILCEDTRVSSVLLRHYGIRTVYEAYHDHSDEKQRQSIVRRILEDGIRFALISDAGSPMICDPGYKLVRDVQHAGGYVTSIPGASSVLTALQLSGVASDSFSFIGFLPNKVKARQQHLTLWSGVPGSLIAFETASRLCAALADIAGVLGDDRRVVVMRELTKKFEEGRGGRPLELLDYYKTHGAPKGEIVLVIAPPSPKNFQDEDIIILLKDALKTMRTKDAATSVAAQTGRPRKDIYALALTLSEDKR